MSAGLPEGVDEFLERAGWAGAEIEPLAGDASFRRYFRVRNGARSAMLMDAPPPHEDPGPFLHVGKWLSAQGLRAPKIYAERPERGLVLIEDFGNDRMRDWLDQNAHAEEETYARAIDALVAPGPRVTKHTPGRPLPAAFRAPSAQAMNAAPPSWRQVTVWIARVSRSASSTGRKLSPGTVKTRSQPCSTRQSTRRRAAAAVMGQAIDRSCERGNRPGCVPVVDIGHQNPFQWLPSG